MIYKAKTNPVLVLVLLFTQILTAQVGIGTTDPQQDLHIAGNNATIRIDGLSAANNANNDGGIYTHNIEVDANGDLIVGKTKVESIINSKNTVSEVVILTATNSGLNSGEIYSRPFTLDRRALIFIEYTVSFTVLSFDGLCAVNDGRAKILHNFYYLGDGTTADTTNSFGLISEAYSNANDNAATGYIYNSGGGKHILEAGTYSIHLFGSVFGGGIDTTAAFRGVFGNQETLKVIAYYF